MARQQPRQKVKNTRFAQAACSKPDMPPVDSFCSIFEGNAKTTALEAYKKDSLLAQGVATKLEDALANWRTGREEFDTQVKMQRTMLVAGMKAAINGKAMLVPIITDNAGTKLGVSRLIRDDYRGVIGRIAIVDEWEDGTDLDQDSLSENHGKPKYYILNGKRIHHTRVYIMGSDILGASFYEQVSRYFKAFHSIYSDLEAYCQEANIPTLGTHIDSLISQFNDMKQAGIAANANNAREAIENRGKNFRPTMADRRNAYIYDKEKEAVGRVPITNIDDIQKAAEFALDVLSAAVDVPPTRFVGKSYGSLNSSNTSEQKYYDQTLKSLRFKLFNPALEYFDRLDFKLKGQEYVKQWEWKPTPFVEVADGVATDS